MVIVSDIRGQLEDTKRYYKQSVLHDRCQASIEELVARGLEDYTFWIETHIAQELCYQLYLEGLIDRLVTLLENRDIILPIDTEV